MTDLPPLEQPQAYVVVGPDDQRGPYTLELLIGEVLAGRLHDQTPVWWPGLAEWTTMSGHPALAGEIDRRRAAYAHPQAFTPPAPTPGQYEQYQGYGAYGDGQAVAAQPTQAVSGQDFSADAWAAPSQPVETATGGAVSTEPFAPVTAEPEVVQPSQGFPAEGERGAVPMGDQVPAEVTGGVDADVSAGGGRGAAATGVAGAEAPPHDVAVDRSGFHAVVDRSRRHADAVARVEEADGRLVEAASAGALDAGFSPTDRTDAGDTHELRFSDGGSRTVSVSMGRLSGTVDAVRGTHVPLEVRATDHTYGGGVDVSQGDHGEVVVVADEWNGQATSMVRLHLPVDRYLGDDLQVDDEALRSDVAAVVSVVLDRLR
jgi:hypothetical protein